MAGKRNYRQEMEKILAEISATSTSGEPVAVGTTGEVSAPVAADKSVEVSAPAPRKPTLLLHACCGPCSSYCIETLVPYFDITIYYYNPNISPQQEYDRRLSELAKFLARFPDAISGGVKLVEAQYNPEEFYDATNVRNEPELAAEPERGERCRRCYSLRMGKAYEYACANGFDWFTTTLSISPHKDAEKINVIGFALEAGALEAAQTQTTAQTQKSQPHTKATRFLPSDFKKKNGFLRSTQLTEEYGMWRQDYCGCTYSMRKGL